MQFQEIKDLVYLKIAKNKLDEALDIMHQHFGQCRQAISLLQADYSNYTADRMISNVATK